MPGSVSVKIPLTGLKTIKQQNSLMPNFIHSLDAANIVKLTTAISKTKETDKAVEELYQKFHDRLAEKRVDVLRAWVGRLNKSNSTTVGSNSKASQEELNKALRDARAKMQKNKRSKEKWDRLHQEFEPQVTACTAPELNAPKPPNLLVIHDCFGTHAIDVPIVKFYVKAAFIQIYANKDVLTNFHNQCVAVLQTSPNYRDGGLYHKSKQIPIPQPPELGDLDIKNIINSEHMVS